MVLLLLVDTNFQHRPTDLHLSKLTMTMPTFRDVSKFSSVNKADESISSEEHQTKTT